MSSDLTLKQTASVQIVRKPVPCSKCGEPRTQDSRCENCGSEVPYSEERKKNDSSSKS